MPEIITGIDVKVRNKNKHEQPKKYNVIMYNDDITPAFLVVEILKECFDKKHREAVAIMMSINNSDKGLVGVYSEKEAYERVEKADAIKAQYNAPLIMTIEEAE